MPWSFPILSMLRSVFKPPQEPEPEQGPPRPPFPPPLHETDLVIEQHGTYANQYGTSYNVIYWPDLDTWSYHFAEGAAKGHSAKRKWYTSKNMAVAEIEAM